MAIKPYNRKILAPEHLETSMTHVPSINRNIKSAYEGQNTANYSLDKDLSKQEEHALTLLYVAAGWDKVEVRMDRDGNSIHFESSSKPKYLGVKALDYSVPFGPDALYCIEPNQERKVSGLERRIDRHLKETHAGEDTATFDLDISLTSNEFKELTRRYLEAGWSKVRLYSDQREGNIIFFYT